MLLLKAIPKQHKLSLKIGQSFNILLLLGYGYQTKGKGQLYLFSSGDLKKGEYMCKMSTLKDLTEEIPLSGCLW